MLSLFWVDKISPEADTQTTILDRKVSLNLQNVRVRDVWRWVESASNLPVLAVYLNDSQNVNLSLHDEPLAVALDKIGSITGTEWFLSNDPKVLVFKTPSGLSQQFLKQKEETLIEAIAFANAQTDQCINALIRDGLVALSTLSSQSLPLLEGLGFSMVQTKEQHVLHIHTLAIIPRFAIRLEDKESGATKEIVYLTPPPSRILSLMRKRADGSFQAIPLWERLRMVEN